MKIETKSSIWHVVMSSGAYSDYREYHVFISANSREEVKKILKDYIRTHFKELDTYKAALKFENGEIFVFDKENLYGKEISEINTDSSYGDVLNVDMSMLKVIYP